MIRNNIHIVGVPEEEREQKIKNLFEEIWLKTSLTWWNKKTGDSKND